VLYVEIDIHSPVPIYEQIMDQVRGLVRAGRLAPGTTLPSVRQLAADLELNPNTVARAYSLLERDGVVKTARRRGTVVAGAAPSKARKAVHLRLQQAVDHVLEHAASLGIESEELLEALQARLRRRGPSRRSPRRRSE
jgi:GntR family transcriptional regulator